jgi:hypothetical protein
MIEAAIAGTHDEAILASAAGALSFGSLQRFEMDSSAMTTLNALS